MSSGNTNFLTALPLFGAAASIALFYNQIKSGISRFVGCFIKKCNIPLDLLAYVYADLTYNSFTYDSDDYRIRCNSMFSIEHKCWFEAYLKQFKSQIFLYHHCIPVVLLPSNNGDIMLHYLKFTFNFEKFILASIKRRNQNLSASYATRKYEFRIETFKGQSLKVSNAKDAPPGIGNDKPDAVKSTGLSDEVRYSLLDGYTSFEQGLRTRFLGLDTMGEVSYFMPTSAKSKYQLTSEGQMLLGQMEKWLSLRAWYEERDIAWRRGVCLWGSAGNGKSSMILEIAKTVGLPLFVFDISSMDNTEFKKYIDIVEHLPGILLFEDIDSIFTGRDNLVKGRYGSLTFDFFINQLSGISSIRNKFIFFTTNYLEKLDPALIRPGRVDEIVEVKPLTLDEKKKLAGIFIEDDMAAVEKCVADGRDDTTAQFENRCTKIVLERIWKPSTG